MIHIASYSTQDKVVIASLKIKVLSRAYRAAVHYGLRRLDKPLVLYSNDMNTYLTINNHNYYMPAKSSRDYNMDIIFDVGDLEAREQRGRTVSAVNPLHDDEHEADWEDMEPEEMIEKKIINPAYEGILTDQFVFEETELQANGGYSRLSSRMGSIQRRPQHRHFVETSAGTPHYSSLDLNSGSTATDSGEQRTAAQDPKNHQYEDVDGEGEVKVKISNDRQSCERNREHITTSGLYEDVSIGKPEAVQSVKDCTESCSYEEVGEFKQLQVDIEAEKGRGEFENRELDVVGEMEWNGMQNYSDDLELNQGTDDRESSDSMLDSKVEGTCV